MRRIRSLNFSRIRLIWFLFVVENIVILICSRFQSTLLFNISLFINFFLIFLVKIIRLSDKTGWLLSILNDQFMLQTFYTILVLIFIRILIDFLRRVRLFFTWLKFLLVVLLIRIFFKEILINLPNHSIISMLLFLINNDIVVHVNYLSFWINVYLLCLFHQCVWWLYYLVFLFAALLLFVLLSISSHFTQILFFSLSILQLAFLLVLAINVFQICFFLIFLVIVFL